MKDHEVTEFLKSYAMAIAGIVALSLFLTYMVGCASSSGMSEYGTLHGSEDCVEFQVDNQNFYPVTLYTGTGDRLGRAEGMTRETFEDCNLSLSRNAVLVVREGVSRNEKSVDVWETWGEISVLEVQVTSHMRQVFVTPWN